MNRVDFRTQQELLKRGSLQDDTFERLKQKMANPEPKPDVAIDSTGRMQGTNIYPDEIKKKEPIDPLTQLKETEQTNLVIDDEPVDMEQASVQSNIPQFEDYTAGFKMGQEALASKAKAETEKANALLEEQQEQDKELRAREVAIQEEREQEREYLDNARMKVDQKQQEYNEKPANINQLFQDKSTGGKVMMGLSLFLGSAPNSSGQNKAVQVISNAIEQDLNKQEREITGQRGIYNDMRDSFQDKEQARMAAYETTMKQLQRQLEIEGAKYNDPTIQANKDAAIAQIQSQMDTARANFDQATAANMLKAQELQGKQKDLYVPGQGYALTKKDAETAKEYLTDSKNLQDIITEMENLREEYGGEVANREAVNKGKQLATEAALLMKDIAKLGVLAGPDMDLLNKLIPEDPLSFLPSTGAKIGNLKKMVKNKESTFLKARGFEGQEDFDRYKD